MLAQGLGVSLITQLSTHVLRIVSSMLVTAWMASQQADTAAYLMLVGEGVVCWRERSCTR